MAATLFPAVGTREDLMDVISVVDAKNTPIYKPSKNSKPL
jgi:hypothetical protein